MWGVEPAYFEQVPEGFEFGGSAITVTEAHLVAYAGLLGDFFPLHMDAEHAAASRFGQRIAHGPFTLALTIGQLAQRITHMGWQVEAALGVDAVRFRAPVFLGDTLTPTARVTGATARESNGALRMAIRAGNQRGEDVMTGEFGLLMARRPQMTDEGRHA